jgi:hypothetical protein
VPLFRRDAVPSANPTFGPTSGGVSGISGLVLAVIVVFTSLTDGMSGQWSFVVGSVLFGGVCWSVLLRPRVRLDPDVLVLRNAISDYRIPYARLDLFVVRSVSTAYVGKKKYVGLGVTRTRRAMTRGPRPRGLGEVRGFEGPRSENPGRLPANAADLVIELVSDRIRNAAPTTEKVRRVPAWPEIAGFTVTIVVLVLTLAL